MKQKISPAGSIDLVGIKKVGRGALIAGGSAVLTYVAEALPGIDFGEWTPIVMAISGVIINLARKLLTKQSN